MLLIPVLVTSLGARPAEPATPGGSEVIYVDQANVRADDSNPGTVSDPLKTIGRALQLAADYNARSIAVRVVIGAGTYRESLAITSADGSTPAPLTIEGEDGVFVSGSDVFEGWTGGDDGVYKHSWMHDWGPTEPPEDWPEQARGYIDANPLIARREMVFVNGVPLLQVLSLDDMKDTENSFFVSEETDELFINIPSESDMALSAVEVAVRPTLLAIDLRENVSVIDITFLHSSSPLQASAVSISNSRDVEVIGSRFIWNNGFGLGLSQDSGVTIKESEANSNGISGFTGYRVGDLNVLDSEASFNGWRGSRGWDIDNHDAVLDPNFIDFATGQKFFGLRTASFKNFRAVDNLSGGLWLDFDNSDVTIEDAVLTGNLTHGLMVEASQGLVSVEESEICGNETGILVSSSSDVHLVDNVLSSNTLGQLVVMGEPRDVYKHDAGTWISVQTKNIIVRNNLLAAGAGQLALQTDLDGEFWSAYVETLDSSDNRYSSPSAREIFQLPGGRTVALAQWKATTGTDIGSTFAVRQPDCPLSQEQNVSSIFKYPQWVAAFLVGLGLLIVGILLRRRAAS